ncbi:hypothetical protein PFTANZ_06494, partial [Plasmodium falciparum Tanzania (2000708)]
INDQRNHKSTTPHTPKIPTTRLLCECDLYMPNYDNDPQMKEVMENYNRQTSDRFKEYDERMKTTRQKCKDKCDKEIQKIILKDKLEKQMAQQLTTLETKIDTNDIPTCVCEKSMVDKMEKNCMKCAQNLGGIVAPSSGVLAGIAEGALIVWKPGALDAAIAAALKVNDAMISTAGIEAGAEAGKNEVIVQLQALAVYSVNNKPLESLIDPQNYTQFSTISDIIKIKKNEFCGVLSTVDNTICENFSFELGTRLPDGKPGLTDATAISQKAQEILTHAKEAADAKTAEVSSRIAADITTKQTTAINSTYASYEITIIASIVAIV